MGKGADLEMERKWQARWKESGLFRFSLGSEKPIYVIDTPPPFTNGALHMGQAFWVCYIDSIARYRRMSGFNVLYPQGWDAHGFPTEIAVEKRYGKGIGRGEFYKRCVEESAGNIAKMRDQMLSLGSSFDDKYEYVTTSDDYMAKVQLSVLEMYDKGFVYRASHPVEWCTSCSTSISREQAEEREEEGLFNHLEFTVKGSKKKLAIATSRPELLHACVAVAVNPDDKRYAGLVGKNAATPVFGKSVPIIADESVDEGFGTGAEMVCTFGDKQDVLLYYKHKLKLIEAMDERGRLKNAGELNGITLEEARAKVIELARQSGALVKQEKMKHVVKVHDRCKTPVEFVSSMQWFMKIKEHAEKLKEVAGSVKWSPEFAKQRFDDWANFVEWDWAISRNRVFGTPIPFWYCQKCGEIVPAGRESLPVDPAVAKPPVDKCKKCGGKIVGEKATLDGWVDSAITPLFITGWPNKKDPRRKGFPTALRIQGTDIIRTWAFYTVYRVWALAMEKPWSSIISHGMILGQDGREMHKSWGNGVEPIELIQKYGADSVRLWVALSGGIVKDKPFSYQDIEYARSFITKLSNTANFVKLVLADGRPPKEEPHGNLGVFDIWILNRFNSVAKQVLDAYESHMLYEAMNAAINFYWHEFADYYIENVKYRVYSEDKGMQKSRKAALYTLHYIFMNSIRLFAPVIPHTAEQLNEMFSGAGSIFNDEMPEYIEKDTESAYVMNGLVFKSGLIDVNYEEAGAFLNRIIAEVRKAKSGARIALNKGIPSINIKVPEEYYNVVEYSKDELSGICKVGKVNVSKGEYSIEIKI